jgi:hypothetical protein
MAVAPFEVPDLRDRRPVFARRPSHRHTHALAHRWSATSSVSVSTWVPRPHSRRRARSGHRSFSHRAGAARGSDPGNGGSPAVTITGSRGVAPPSTDGRIGRVCTAFEIRGAPPMPAVVGPP